MNLILTMTLSGSLLYLITIVAEKVYKKFFSTNFLCFMFKAALILHFLPLACVKIFFHPLQTCFKFLERSQLLYLPPVRHMQQILLRSNLSFYLCGL